MQRPLRHSLLTLTLLAALAGCGGSDDENDDGPTRLAISAWPTGRDGPVHHWTLRCPAGGPVPMPARACQALLALDHPLSSTPAGRACTQIYGGPAVATVAGTFRGRRVRAEFSRIDGCQIERWNAIDFLFPGVRAA